MQGNFLEVYLIYSQLTRRKKPLDLPALFARKRDTIDLGVDHRLVFIEEDKALHYAHFLHETDALFRSFLPETAIEGDYEQLSLKKGIVKKYHVQGAYQNDGHRRRYYENPFFDQTLLSMVSVSQKLQMGSLPS